MGKGISRRELLSLGALAGLAAICNGCVPAALILNADEKHIENQETERHNREMEDI